MTLEEFVKEINKIQNPELKQKQIKKHIKREYCPVKEKIDFLKKIKELSYNEMIKNIDFLYNKILFKLGVLIIYTDIQIDINIIENVYNNYDLLMSQKNLLEKVCLIIDNDISELLSINEFILMEK